MEESHEEDAFTTDILCDRAEERYGVDIPEAALCGLFLAGDDAVRSQLRRDFEKEHPAHEYPNFALRSLQLALLQAPEGIDFGKMDATQSYLEWLSMWGTGRFYSEPYTKLSGEETTIELPCWDTFRLAELYALGYRWMVNPVPEVGKGRGRRSEIIKF